MTLSAPEAAKNLDPAPLERLHAFSRSLGQVILGKEQVIEQALTALLAKGHLLIEDVPGVGKTTLARALAKGAGLPYRRLQFTADLLPSDVTGVSVFNPETHQFEFHKGALFTSILLADEINRATPKTQSALLEAMSEFQVTHDQGTEILPNPFFVVATQNPQEHYGTFPLPESQMDRFLMRIGMGYPPPHQEQTIMRQQRFHSREESMPACLEAGDIPTLQTRVQAIFVKEDLVAYMQNLVAKTRGHEAISLGVSPRGAIGLYRCCQARALLNGRDFVIPDDILILAPAVLGHRISLKGRPGADSQIRQDQEETITEILALAPPPM